MVVMEPLKVTITNFPKGGTMELTVPNFPADEARGSHVIKFDSVIYIEKSDFTEVNRAYSPFNIIVLLLSLETCERLQTASTQSALWPSTCWLYHHSSRDHSRESLKVARTTLRELHLSLQDSNNEPIELKVTCQKATDEGVSKPKGFIHWVSHPNKCEIRLYDRLFVCL
jgi:glutaminyl-tRNA synthetase